MALVSGLADERYQGRANYQDAIDNSDMSPDEYCLANFYTLGCRFAGYLGPFQQGYFSPEAAVRAALKMGCRTFVYEIGCYKGNYPRLVVRNTSRIRQFVDSHDTDVNSDTNSNILQASAAIAQNAFNTLNDPIIIVLYILDLPPEVAGKDYNKALIKYYSQIAQNLAPLLTYSVARSPGNYFRQQNESQLLKNSIDTYNKKVLFFSNASTELFRTANPPIDTSKDLDYIVNLRLTATQTPLGVTLTTNPNSNGSKFGLLDTVNSYTTIPANMTASTEKTIQNGTWVICLTSDPGEIVPQTTTNTLQQQFGIHCIPIQIWSREYDYMFTEKYFKRHSYVPKPQPLRVPMSAITLPGKAAKQADAKGGVLTPPHM